VAERVLSASHFQAYVYIGTVPKGILRQIAGQIRLRKYKGAVSYLAEICETFSRL
jgi:hypothetical protein